MTAAERQATPAINDPAGLSLLGSWLDSNGKVHNHPVPKHGPIRFRWGTCNACDHHYEKAKA